jgi:chromosome segregation ATPase
LSKPNEFEKLQTKKSELEAESVSLKEKQKNMEERLMILEEKIAIEELKNNNNAAREAIGQLETKINGLETKLQKASQTPITLEPAAPAKEPEPETAKAPKEETIETVEPAPEEFEADVVTVTAIDGESMVANQEELGENLKAQLLNCYTKCMLTVLPQKRGKMFRFFANPSLAKRTR